MTKVVKQILLINIIVFIFQSLLTDTDSWFVNLALWPEVTGFSQMHQWVTHMFLHSNFAHIFFNMLVFISFGPTVEKYLGNRFIWFYIFAGLFAAVLHTIVTNPTIPMIGASGAVFGVLAASAVIDPNIKVYPLFIPIPIKLKWIIPILLVFELTMGIIANDNVGHFAHIGGVIVGIIYISYLKYFKNETR